MGSKKGGFGSAVHDRNSRVEDLDVGSIGADDSSTMAPRGERNRGVNDVGGSCGPAEHSRGNNHRSALLAYDLEYRGRIAVTPIYRDQRSSVGGPPL